jgi:hypothetical protein
MLLFKCQISCWQLKKIFDVNHRIKFALFSAILDGKQSPPYVDPNTATGYDQNQIPFQPPIVVPAASFPKGNIFNEFINKDIET